MKCNQLKAGDQVRDSVNLLNVGAEDRPQKYQIASYNSATIALDAVLAGHTTYAAVHAVYASWLPQNQNCEEKPKERWAVLRVDEQFKDCIFPNIARAYLMEHREVWQGEEGINMDIIASGGLMTLSDLEQELFPQTWDPFIEAIADVLPTTLSQVRRAVHDQLQHEEMD